MVLFVCSFVYFVFVCEHMRVRVHPWRPEVDGRDIFIVLPFSVIIAVCFVHVILLCRPGWFGDKQGTRAEGRDQGT